MLIFNNKSHRLINTRPRSLPHQNRRSRIPVEFGLASDGGVEVYMVDIEDAFLFT